MSHGTCYFYLFLPIQAAPDKSASVKFQRRSLVSACSCWQVILTLNIHACDPECHPLLLPLRLNLPDTNPAKSENGLNSITRPQQVDQRVQDSLLKSQIEDSVENCRESSIVETYQKHSKTIKNPSLVWHCFSGRQNERENDPRQISTNSTAEIA